MSSKIGSPKLKCILKCLPKVLDVFSKTVPPNDPIICSKNILHKISQMSSEIVLQMSIFFQKWSSKIASKLPPQMTPSKTVL